MPICNPSRLPMYEQEYEAKCDDGQAGYPQIIINRLRIPHLVGDKWFSVIMIEDSRHDRSKSRAYHDALWY